MTSKQEIIASLKAENPDGLKVGNDQDGYTKLSETESNEIFGQWATAMLAKEARIAAEQAAKASAEAKLKALGLTPADLKALGL